MNNPDSISTSALSGGEKTTFRARIPKYTIRFLALLGLALLLWKVIAVSVLESTHEDALEALRDSTAAQIASRTTVLARAAGESAGAALLPVLRDGDQGRLVAFVSELTRRMGTRDYILTDGQGVIRAATSATMVGQPLDVNLQRVAASLEVAMTDEIAGGLTRIIIPLRDRSGSAGTLILIYRFGE
jgi:hypothetical protein